jgi:hypothetical protein
MTGPGGIGVRLEPPVASCGLPQAPWGILAGKGGLDDEGGEV